MTKKYSAPAERPEPPEEGFDAHWRKPPDDWTPAEQKELQQLTRLPDVEILNRAGTFGPAVIGRPLAYLAAKVRITNPDGTFGPAILDPDYDAKSLAARGLRRTEGGRIEPMDKPPSESGAAPIQTSDPTVRTADALNDAGVPIDPSDLTDPRNPWTYVTLSGAKQLAMKHEVSHKTRVTRVELIAQLQAAQVAPPPAPSKEDLENDDETADEDERRRQRLSADLERTNPGATSDTR
jgi:hypothetical protein